MEADLRAVADEYLEWCFAQETPPRASELARRAGVSPFRIGQLFTATFGEPAGAYLRRRQVEHAMFLMRTTELPLSAIAYRSGFGTRGSFFRAFKRQMGQTPDQWRQGMVLDGHNSGR